MASITILPGNTNLWIAQAIARDNADAQVIGGGHGITIRAPGKLEIERVTVEDAAGKPLDDGAWKSFTLNREGRATHADSMEIVIEDA